MIKNATIYFFICILAGFTLVSCNLDQQGSKTKAYYLGKGDKYYGGKFSLNEPDFIGTLYPPQITDAITHRIASQIYEGLVKLDASNIDNEVLNAITASYTIDSSGTVYTFNLRNDVYFHDDKCFKNGKGRLVNAKDFEKCYRRLCTKENRQAFEIIFKDKVVGANDFFNKSLQRKKLDEVPLEGIKALSETTFQIRLTQPYHDFLYLLCMQYCYVYPEEAFQAYGERVTVGTGAFKLTNIQEDTSLTLIKNDNYYIFDEHNNKLPFLDTLEIFFINDKAKEVDLFLSETIDMVYQISTSDIIDIIEVDFTQGAIEPKEYIQQRTPEMIAQFYEFMTADGVFANKNLRKALSYAINRQLILDMILDGAGYAPGIYGITPPVLQDYDVTQISGYELNIDQAKKYLKKAGYNDGSDIGTITLQVNKGGGIHIAVANEVKRQLKKHLNIDLRINTISLNDKLVKTRNGNFQLARSGWVADFASPENFLSLLYGVNVPKSLHQPSYPNTSRYRNEKFDQFYELGLRAKTKTSSNEYFLQAEIEAMEDAPLLILWYDENYRILQPDIRGFPNNPIQYRDFSRVWIDFTKTEEAAKKKAIEQAKKS